MTKDLIDILTWCRGAGTKSEQDFVTRYVASIPGIERDGYGNYHLQIGDEPTVLWSCHTDTVTRKEGRQNVKWVSKGILGLQNAKPGQCLGADDGAGVYLMFQMIKAQKPGYYVFHRDEEIGGLGSSYLKQHPQYFPDTLKYAIAFDRMGHGDIITHQSFSRCCSDKFAWALAEKLGAHWRPDDSGTFTDTANYVGLISECTNLSVGYDANHGPRETLDVEHLMRLKEKILALDVDSLPVEREVGEDQWDYSFRSSNDWSRDPNNPIANSYPYGGDEWERADEYDNLPTLNVIRKPDFARIISEHPGVAARLFEDLGVEFAEFRAHVFAFTGQIYDE